MCDAHVHATAGRDSGELAIGPAREHLSAIGAGRVVVVQTAADGDDAGALVRALEGIEVPAHGVVNLGAAVSTPLEVLAAAGVCGVRVSGLLGASVSAQMLRDAAALAASAGWHVSYYPMTADEWHDMAPVLAGVDGVVVIDHMALRTWRVAAGTNEPAFRLLLDLLDGGAWVKVSGAFRRGCPPGWDDVIPFVRTLIERAPDRVVWGSDWPYFAFDGAPPTPAGLRGWLERALPDEDQQRVLVDNPARLYGFAPWKGTPS